MKKTLITALGLFVFVVHAQNTKHFSEAAEFSTNSVLGKTEPQNTNADTAILADSGTNGVTSTELLRIGFGERLYLEKSVVFRAVVKTTHEDLTNSFPDIVTALGTDDDEQLRQILKIRIFKAPNFSSLKAIAGKLPQKSIDAARKPEE